jgi:hypothetical protein
MRRKLFVIVLLASSLCLAIPGWGIQLKSGENVSIPAGTSTPDDVYAFASNVDVAGRVIGDVLACGGQVNVTGDVTQDVMLTGGNVSFSGKAGDDVMAAGGTVTVAGSVAEDATITGGRITFAKDSTVTRDVLVAGGSIALGGSIGRNAKISGGQVQLDGPIGGSVDVDADQLTVGPNAVIKGDLTYTAKQKPQISPLAKIMGKTIEKPAAARPKPLCAFGCKAAWWFLRFAMLLVAGLVVIALAPKAAELSADAVFGRFWLSLLVGFLFLTVVPIAAVIVMCTVLGLPLGLILFAAYLISMYLSRVFVGLAIGRWLFKRFGNESMSPYLGLLVGLLILWLLTAIPFVGNLIHLLALLVGLGALVTARYTMMKDLRREGRI